MTKTYTAAEAEAMCNAAVTTALREAADIVKPTPYHQTERPDGWQFMDDILESRYLSIRALITKYGTTTHPDDLAVDRFALAMKEKLAKARAKGRRGWSFKSECKPGYLEHLLIEHIGKGNPGTFEDVANFAMMLHQRGDDPQRLADEFNALIGAVLQHVLADVRAFRVNFTWGHKATLEDAQKMTAESYIRAVEVACTPADALAALEQVRKDERERCAKVIEESDCPTKAYLAAAIRKGEQ